MKKREKFMSNFGYGYEIPLWHRQQHQQPNQGIDWDYVYVDASEAKKSRYVLMSSSHTSVSIGVISPV